MTLVNLALRQMRMRCNASVRGAAVVAAVLCAGMGAGARAQYAGAAPQHEASPPPGLTDSSAVVAMLLATPRPPIVLDPGDEIQIEIFEIDKYQYKTRVNIDGTIGMPLIKSISLGGLTPQQAELAITHRLQDDGMVNDPHVHLTILEKPSEIITVSGAVQKAGVFPAFGNSTILNVVAQANGMTDLASRTVTLIRPGAPQAYTLNLGSNPSLSRVGMIPVFAGDTISVANVGVVYVVGAVKTSGVYKLKTETPTTAVEAIAQAGGAGFEAVSQRAEIVRTVNGTRTEILFDYSAALKHLGPDPVLMADDIVFLPTDKMRAALKGGGLGVAVALASAFLYRE